MNEYYKSIHPLLYGSKLNQNNDEDVNVTYLPELFAKMFADGMKIDMLSLLESFQRVVTEATLDEYRIHTGKPYYQKYYETDILACIYLIGIMLLTYTSKNEEYQIHQAVYNFIRQKPQLQNGLTALHMCCTSVTNDNNIDMGNVVSFPNAHISKKNVIEKQ